MAKFAVGMRVRLVQSLLRENVGCEGVVTHIGNWVGGDTLPNGNRLQQGNSVDLFILWARPLLYSCGKMIKHGSSSSWKVEPILPEGAAPSIYSYQELMDKLREGERV